MQGLALMHIHAYHTGLHTKQVHPQAQEGALLVSHASAREREREETKGERQSKGAREGESLSRREFKRE